LTIKLTMKKIASIMNVENLHNFFQNAQNIGLVLVAISACIVWITGKSVEKSRNEQKMINEGIAEKLSILAVDLDNSISQFSFVFEFSKVNAELKQIDLQMDKLVNGYLEAVIEKEIYLRKKDQLLKQKSDLKLKHSDFGSDSKSWLEPLRDFVKTLNYAGKLAAMDADLSAYKALSEKVGSNRLLKDKKIVWDWLPPFDLLLQDKDFQAGTKKSSDKSELKKREEKKELLDWRAHRHPFRTDFTIRTLAHQTKPKFSDL
jgi:hypothetical protein